MLRRNPATFYALGLIGFLGLTAQSASAASEAPKRLRANIESSKTFVLKGNIHASVAQSMALDQGEVSSAQPMPKMSLHFAMTAAQQTDLNQLLAAQQDHRSTQFHKFLTPEEYAARFGLNTADLAKITAWLASNGFSNIQSANSRIWISFNGTAGQAQSAFHTSIHNYQLNGQRHFANASEPELPASLNGIADGIRGLHNYLPRSHARPLPRLTSSISGNTFVAPDDWATIYDVKALYSAGLDGSPIANASGNYCGGPCSIVVVGQSDVQASDLANFRSAAGLPANTITVRIPPGDNDPGLQLQSGDESESDLDLEWAGAIAKNASILFDTADGGVEDAITDAIDFNVAPILSTSYGLCETFETNADVSFLNGLFQQANAQGMTIVSASGDAGAADCDSKYPASHGLAVDFPASSPFVTGVGGSQFTVYNTTGAYWSSTNNSNSGSALQYIPESVWNDTNSANGLSSGGGGASVLATKPSWQTGTGVPNDGRRDVPDIALAASPNEAGLLYCTPDASSPTLSICSNGFRNSDSTFNVIGGTSAGAPPFAGVLSMLVQQTGARLGNINPNLYSLAQISQTVFHDITSGTNIVPCTIGTSNCSSGSMGYSAGVGYDQASGWGSIDAYNFFEQWSADIQISSSPTTLTIQPGSSATSTITVSPYKNFTGTISFACSVSSGLANVTCSVPSTTITTSGTTTVTITAASTAALPFLRLFRNAPLLGPSLLMFALVLTTLCLARKQRFVYVGGTMAVLVFMLGAVSCGGGSSSGSTGVGTTTTTGVAESGNVIVTATSGKIVNSVTIAVSIP